SFLFSYIYISSCFSLFLFLSLFPSLSLSSLATAKHVRFDSEPPFEPIPPVYAVLTVHDTVAQKNFDPVLPPLPDDLEDELEEESVKIVRLVKNKEPLGATIRRDEVTGAVVVARIMRGGAADRSGLVHVGDELREVNGNLIIHKRPDEISQILVCIICSWLLNNWPSQTIPGPLEWLARVGNINLSSNTQEEVRSFRMSRKDRQSSPGESRSAEHGEPEFLTYKEVTRYQQKPSEKPRLVVLIGSLGARINELKQKVIAESPHRYGVAVPHTTRPRKSHEKEGVEYHFISKQAFEADIQSNKFIEYGEYKENQYGTSLESIRSVLSRNKMCLVDVQPEALKVLRTAEFKPYVIFVKPYLPEGRRHRSRAASPEGGDNGHLTDEDLAEMRHSAEQMEQQYSHLVDWILVKEDSASACVELRHILERLEREPQWVPVSWVRP
uniref:Membrane protein, palmitoylated 3b (MAGUK p55 subfamily member 3) n=1 Tax=Astyanax mexicanus TaxID=7994 RepID=A0A8B9H4A2_ASTMX